MKIQFLILIYILFIPIQKVLARPFESHKFSITGPSPYLQLVAERIHNKGGNVADMAVAAALTLSVVTPFYVSLGAGGFALVDFENSVEALDFREMAPQALSPHYYKDKSSTLGGGAVGVPGLVAGLWSLHKKYGKLPWKTLFYTPIELAQKGHRVGGEWAQITREIKNLDYGMEAFFKDSKKPYLPGEIFKQKKLSKALQKIRRQNIQAFYQGSIAEDIVASVEKSGGSMTLEDLKNYKVRWLKPNKKKFMDYEIFVMPPPSSGALVIFSALDLIMKKNLPRHTPLSTNELHLLSEIMSRSFRVRNLVGDPDFYQTSFDQILSSKYMKEMAASISLKRVRNLKPIKETTHLAVMDHKGRSVTMTLTLNLQYGSKVVTPEYGIVLNNQMDDFTTHPNKPNSFGLIQGAANLVEPGKRPVSSMSPTIVKKEGQTVMVLGGSGGPRIISGVLQVLYRSLIQGMNIDQAIQYPRIHHQFLPKVTYVEKTRLSPEILKNLKNKKHVIKEVQHLGKIYGIQKSKDHLLKSAFDHRGDGLAWGI